MTRNLSLTACRNNRLTALLMALAALGIGATAVALASIGLAHEDRRESTEKMRPDSYLLAAGEH